MHGCLRSSGFSAALPSPGILGFQGQVSPRRHPGGGEEQRTCSDRLFTERGLRARSCTELVYPHSNPLRGVELVPPGHVAESTGAEGPAAEPDRYPQRRGRKQGRSPRRQLSRKGHKQDVVFDANFPPAPQPAPCSPGPQPSKTAELREEACGQKSHVRLPGSVRGGPRAKGKAEAIPLPKRDRQRSHNKTFPRRNSKWSCQRDSPGCKPEQHMMYAGSKNRLVQTAELTKVFEIRTTDDLTEAWLQEKLSFFR
uniref:ADF-H domain-containing protein n=1 Tax=Oryctolagus cuniculus TaxID=9986 RepID=A0A5F9CGB7_RABIT